MCRGWYRILPMKRVAVIALMIGSVWVSFGQQPPGRAGGRGRGPAPAQATSEDLARIKDKTEQIEAIDAAARVTPHLRPGLFRQTRCDAIPRRPR